MCLFGDVNSCTNPFHMLANFGRIFFQAALTDSLRKMLSKQARLSLLYIKENYIVICIFGQSLLFFFDKE